jgi:hypothetical protein
MGWRTHHRQEIFFLRMKKAGREPGLRARGRFSVNG